MNLLVLGATGRTGRLVVEQALSAGHTVTALVRSPEKLATGNSNLRVVSGSATDKSDLSRALAGAAGVISTLGGKGSGIEASSQATGAAARPARVSRAVELPARAPERDGRHGVSRPRTRRAMG